MAGPLRPSRTATAMDRRHTTLDFRRSEAMHHRGCRLECRRHLGLLSESGIGMAAGEMVAGAIGTAIVAAKEEAEVVIATVVET